MARQCAYTTLSALFVRKPLVGQVFAKNGPTVDISTGFLGRRASKRGSVSLDFKVVDSNFRVINSHIAADSFANRLRDLSKIMSNHTQAVEDDGTNIFLCGAFNFTQKGEFATGSTTPSRNSCEILSLKDTASAS